MPRDEQEMDPAPPNPGIKPGGIRDRAMQAVLARGPRPPETPEELRRAQEFWAKYRAEQTERAAEDSKTGEKPHEPPRDCARRGAAEPQP